MWLFFLFLTIPLLEIAFFIQIGGWLGLFPTLLIVIVTAALGAILVRSQAISAFGANGFQLSVFQQPEKTLAIGGMILLAGALLLTPGFFTDTIGFLLLTPWFRNRMFCLIKKKLAPQSFTKKAKYSNYQRYKKNNDSSIIIEGEYREEDSQKPRQRDNSSNLP